MIAVLRYSLFLLSFSLVFSSVMAQSIPTPTFGDGSVRKTEEDRFAVTVTIDQLNLVSNDVINLYINDILIATKTIVDLETFPGQAVFNDVSPSNIIFDQQNEIKASVSREGIEGNFSEALLIRFKRSNEPKPPVEEPAPVVEPTPVVEPAPVVEPTPVVETPPAPVEVEETPPPVVEEKPKVRTLDDLKDELANLQNIKLAIENLLLSVAGKIQTQQDNIQSNSDIIIYISEGKALPVDVAERVRVGRGITAPDLTDIGTQVKFIEHEIEIDSLLQEEGFARSKDEVVTEANKSIGKRIPTYISTLRLGDRNEQVYLLQIFLNENGFTVAEFGDGSPGAETNFFDQNTFTALKTFQIVNGLRATGEFDKATANLIIGF